MSDKTEFVPDWTRTGDVFLDGTGHKWYFVCDDNDQNGDPPIKIQDDSRAWRWVYRDGKAFKTRTYRLDIIHQYTPVVVTPEEKQAAELSSQQELAAVSKCLKVLTELEKQYEQGGYGSTYAIRALRSAKIRINNLIRPSS